MPTDDDLEPRRSLLLRGVLDMCVLSMVNRQPDHVYGLVSRMADRGLERVSFGSLYPLVNRLRQQGLLHDTSVASPVGPPRTVLSLTSAGESALARWSKQWRNMNAAVGRLLEPLEAGPSTTQLKAGGAL
ncbi:MAG: PadR family transcriptional regulator [Myxococcales bacterium]|nr:MAG: PadR family transcriptional regulator [Myxococcales bacterium]